MTKSKHKQKLKLLANYRNKKEKTGASAGRPFDPFRPYRESRHPEILKCVRDWCTHLDSELTTAFRKSEEKPYRGEGEGRIFELAVLVLYEEFCGIESHKQQIAFLRDLSKIASKRFQAEIERAKEETERESVLSVLED